ncbi:hypothetical protein [Fusibacter sp. JL216-2]|uniref:hypothetical protein n=1 Tax=Fusibacter sp. JL216-2 TaxID=3071453 RepID=UPI003D339BAD
MKKIFQPWRLIIVLMFLMIFSSLFAFIYTEQVKLPSEGWSNQIEIDAYNPKMDFESLSSNNTLAIATDNSHFVNITALENEIILKKFDLYGEMVQDHVIEMNHGISEISGSNDMGTLNLIAVSKDEGIVFFLSIDATEFTLLQSDSLTLKDMSYKLSSDHVTAYNDTDVLMLAKGQSRELHPNFDGRIELAEVNIVDGKTILSAITMRGSTYHLSVMTEEGDMLYSENLYRLPSLSAINPVNIAMAIQDEKAVVISTMKHMRFGTNYVDFFEFNIHAPADFLHTGYEIDTYEAVPYLIQEDNGQLSYLINFWASNLGRTEIAKGVQAYPNLYKTTHGTDEFKQLSKSERSSVKPSYFKLGEFDYLIHNEQNDLVNHVYISSNNPKLIEMSRDYTKDTLFDIFMRTITTYPALILAGIPPMMTAILPLLVITAPVLMFKLNWAEQNKTKMTLIIFFVYMASKIYTFGFDIFPFFTNKGLWPPYLESNVAHWGAFVLFSALTLLVYFNRSKTREGKNDHFLKAISFYVILDLVIMITFFMPYSII